MSFLGACLTVTMQSYLPKVKTGHVVPEIQLQRIKERLSQVRGSVVECPLVRSRYYVRNWRSLVTPGFLDR
jgi:hypothetical protein